MEGAVKGLWAEKEAALRAELDAAETAASEAMLMISGCSGRRRPCSWRPASFVASPRGATGSFRMTSPSARVAVANAAGFYSADVADHAVGLLIDVLRGVFVDNHSVRRGHWPERRSEFLTSLGSRIGGNCVGIIGLGSIGSAIARRLAAFGCVVSYHSRWRRDDELSSSSYGYCPTARNLAAHSDVLVVACALTVETRHIVDGGVLDALGKDGVVVNVARRANVAEAKLVQALAEGRLVGAGLDVFEDEPRVSKELLANISNFTS